MTIFVTRWEERIVFSVLLLVSEEAGKYLDKGVKTDKEHFYFSLSRKNIGENFFLMNSVGKNIERKNTGIRLSFSV